MIISNLIDVFIEKLRIQNYNDASVKKYKSNILQFFNFYSEKCDLFSNPSIIEIEKYLNWKKNTKKISTSHQRSILLSISKFYILVLNQPIDLRYLYPKIQVLKSIKYLKKSETAMLIENTSNIKHKCILMLLYSTGIKLNELVNLKISDIDTQNMDITINSSNSKFRKVMLSQIFLKTLKSYYKEYSPKIYVFEGKEAYKYSKRSVQQIVKSSAQNCNIKENINSQILRHTFAIHLLENGTDIRYIKELLGHENVRTTESYYLFVEVLKNKLKSPLDFLMS